MSAPTPDEVEAADVLRGMLPSEHFWTQITLEDVRLEGGYPDTQLVVLLRQQDRPSLLYGLVTALSRWDFVEAGLGSKTPQEWAGWLHDAVMEAVDAAPGLPLGPVSDDGIVWIDLDA